MTDKAKMSAHKEGDGEIERVKDRKRARVERGADDVPMEH